MSRGGDDRSPFVRPPVATVNDIAALALANAGERISGGGAWIESGSRSLVLLHGDTAVRIVRQPHDSPELLRTQSLVDRLPALPFEVPRSVGMPATLDGYVAVATRRLSGAPHEPGHGDAAELRRLLTSIHAIDPDGIRPYLAEPRAYMGGAAWEEVLRADVIPRIDHGLRGEALARVDDLARLQPPSPAVNHGDLAGGNVLWSGGRVSAVLDWDLAALDDPAEDAAALASWHGWSIIAELTDSGTAARAAVFRRTFPLQVVAFSLLRDRPADEVRRAIVRAEEDLRARGGSGPRASPEAPPPSDPS